MLRDRSATRPSVAVEDIARLISPRSIALIGATDRSGWSWEVFKNLASDRFDGEVHLVNPRGGVVHGRRAFSSVAELPDDVDLAYVMVGTNSVLDAMKQIAAKGIRYAIVLTAGFGEMGQEGAVLQEALLDVATEYGLTILGPNSNGLVNVRDRTCPFGLAIRRQPDAGSVSMALQSGGVASMVMDIAAARNLGLRLLVSTGNELTTSLTDIVRFLVDDEHTKVIAIFVESIRDPQAFRQVAAAAFAANKPIVAMKVGRSVAGARVASAHTGALVGNDGVIDAVFAQLGVIRVTSLEELVVTAELLAAGQPLGGRRFALISDSGGCNEIITDCGEEAGIEFPNFAPETEAALRAMLPPFASPSNPVDVTGVSVMESDLVGRAVVIAAADENIDAVVTWGDLPRYSARDEDEQAAFVSYYRQQSEAFAKAGKPVIVLGTAFTDVTNAGVLIARETAYPSGLGGMHHGMMALGHAVRWHERQRTRKQARVENAVLKPIEVNVGTAERYAERRASDLLRKHGVAMVPASYVETADEAAAAANSLGYPVVVKLAADEVEHKSDIGGVVLNLKDADDVRRAFVKVQEAGHKVGVVDPAALVQPQRHGGVELIVGVLRDPDWGLVLAVGLGGIWVEVFKDSVLHPLPCDALRVREGLSELRASALLRGVRGTKPADLDAITSAVMRIAEVAQRLGDRLESLEINPLLVRGDEVEALDALITWRVA